MNDLFTQRVRKVLFLARDEAGRLQHEYIGTEHLLLGIIREGEGVAANVLRRLGIEFDRIQKEIEATVAPMNGPVSIGEIPFTPRAKKVLELSIDEARLHNHNYVGTEHLLLGLLREQDGVAAQVLMNLNLRLEDVREEVLNLLGASDEADEVEIDAESIARGRGLRRVPRAAGRGPTRRMSRGAGAGSRAGSDAWRERDRAPIRFCTPPYHGLTKR